MKQFCPKAKLYSRRRSSRIEAALSLKSEEDIAAEKKFLRAAVTPVRDYSHMTSVFPGREEWLVQSLLREVL